MTAWSSGYDAAKHLRTDGPIRVNNGQVTTIRDCSRDDPALAVFESPIFTLERPSLKDQRREFEGKTALGQV